MRIGLTLIAISQLLMSAGADLVRSDDRTPSFGRDIQPLLSKKCFACHGPSSTEDLVRLDRREEALESEAIVPGKPDESELMRRISSADPEVRMPPKGDPLTAAEIGRLRQWIAAGAPYELHWAFQKPVPPAVPEVHDARWPRGPIDRFVLSRLEQEGLAPAPEADPRTLIRRLYFDLLGLPPTPGEIADFELRIADSRKQLQSEFRIPQSAIEAFVDRLLDSPRYGERTAQHWLDVVRFAETEGFEYDRQLPGVWRFRDYVVDAMNADLPYDEFIRQQLAGDEIAPDNRQYQVAVGFHRLGPVRRNAGNPDVALSRNEVLTTRTDIIGAAFLGLTLGCARCHDHKFDPISQQDYYRLQAFLASTQEHDITLASAEEQAAWKTRTEAVNAEIKTLSDELKSAKGQRIRELQDAMEALDRTLPQPLPCVTTIRNGDEPTRIHVLTRGEEDKKAEPVGMGVPRVFVPKDTPDLPLAAQGARRRLADWLTHESNPLTARVIVNRVWQSHFGTGLVATANDFGLHGEPPSHPELLDYLATQFVAGGWRLKALHRAIVLSSAYRQSSYSPVADRAKLKDPSNRLLWHFAVRRLDAESIRDAMLAASGRLNLKAGGPSVVVPVDKELTALLYKPSQWTVTADAGEHDRRSIYLIAKRNLRLPFMETFDQPPLQNSCGRRESSTHAPQALELLNGKLSNELAAAFAERLEREAGSDQARQIERAYLLVTGRLPTERERSLANEFLVKRPLREFALAMFNVNAFLYVY